MRVEDRLARALREEAGAVEVDVARLHAETLRRVAARPAPRRGSRVAVPVAAAVVVLALAAGVLALVQGLRGIDLPGPASNGPVDRGFSCAHRETLDLVHPVDDAFQPTLANGAAAFAREVRAPRHALTISGRTATLRLGNADGSLASRTRFTRAGNGPFRAVEAVLCTGAGGGILVPGEDLLRLGPHSSATPYPSSIVQGSSPVLVDDRSYYDVAGLVRHRSLWAAQCGRRVCLSSGQPDAFTTTSLRPDGRPHDLTSLVVPADQTVGRTLTLGLWAVYDRDETVTSVRVERRDGTDLPAVRLTGRGWTGRIHVVAAPPRQVVSVALDTVDGRTRRWARTSVPGYTG